MPFEVHFGCWGWPWTSCWRPLEMTRAWPGSRTGPGTLEWAGLHSRPGGSIVLLGSRDPGNGQCWGWICHFLAVLYTRQHKTISNKTGKVDCHNIEGPVRLDSLFAAWWHPLKRGRRIYTYVYTYTYMYIYVYNIHIYMCRSDFCLAVHKRLLGPDGPGA